MSPDGAPPVSARLDIEPAPETWLMGPTEERPAELWLPEAVTTMVAFLGIEPDDQRGRQYVEAVLTRFVDPDASPLAYRLLRWRGPDDQPLPVFAGMVDRDEFDDEARQVFLLCEDRLTVERPIVEEVTDLPAGLAVRRGLAYAHNADGALEVSLRYVIDSGDPHLVALLYTAGENSGQIVEAIDDLDALSRTIRATTVTGKQP